MARGGLRNVDTYLTPRARADLAQAIEEAEGNEVFFVGRPAAVGRIDEVEVFCRGNKHSVPALRQVGRPGEVVIHNHPSGRLTPSQPDIELASHYGQEGVGFMIINNDVDAIYVVVEPLRDTRKPVEVSEVVDLLAGDRGRRICWPITSLEGQIEMASLITEAQNGDGVLVVEAGTGTGKSLGYLIPSAQRAVQNEERVAVATRTRHLQGQLMDKDVPLLQKIWPELKVSVLKGRGNYLCRRKLGVRLANLERGGGKRRTRSFSFETSLHGLPPAQRGIEMTCPSCPTSGSGNSWLPTRSTHDALAVRTLKSAFITSRGARPLARISCWSTTTSSSPTGHSAWKQPPDCFLATNMWSSMKLTT